MKSIRKALARVREALDRDRRLLRRARKRYKSFQARAARNHDAGVATQKRADRLRAAGRRATAEREDRKAARCHHRAYRSHLKAQWWLGRVKVLVQRVHGLETRAEVLRARARRYRESHGVTVTGNCAFGGTQVQREIAVAEEAAARCASGKRPNFYSQLGPLDLDHAITGPAYGHRSDCSEFYAGTAKSSGADDPSGTDWGANGPVWTGTLGTHGREVSLAELEAHGTGAILYGPWPHHHVERLTGPGRTIGHGSASVDPGIPDLFGDGDFHCRIYG